MTTAGQAKLSCQELVELVTDYLEDVLGAEERARFEQHIGTCAGCTEYLEQLRTTIRLSGLIRPADLSPEAERALLEAFRDWATA
ncbi:MAG TPA: zf-HC2 domain-containing protein [Gaiellaceae bacterium]